ncbi:polyketide synthase [Xylariaceae sp. FL0662B]|nr:polyketide synthase [Xylariaceae sp. FL0662B]
MNMHVILAMAQRVIAAKTYTSSSALNQEIVVANRIAAETQALYIAHHREHSDGKGFWSSGRTYKTPTPNMAETPTLTLAGMLSLQMTRCGRARMMKSEVTFTTDETRNVRWDTSGAFNEVEELICDALVPNGIPAGWPHQEPAPSAAPESHKAGAPSELNTDDNDPITICGFSIKFPQETTCSESFWKLIQDGCCAMTDFPTDRLSVRGFHHRKSKANTIPLRGGYFINEDLSLFDADFFSISPAEATAMDPMRRWLLETAWDSNGASIRFFHFCLTGSFGYDYLVQLYRDTESPPKYAAVGVALSMLANRLGWFFNLRGPSVGLDTACSSAATALDITFQSLKAGTCDTSLVAGASLTFAPEPYTLMTNLGFLSPDSRCYSFDHRANGYSRGEGIAVLVLKRLSDAIKDGNTIRAIIRSTALNEDGKTPGITQPSRRDLREAQAIGMMAFRNFRSSDPLYVKGHYTPNANFETVNPKIDTKHLWIKFPTQSFPWPTEGLRRASINSFGYGGANSHIVLDDAFNYLRLRSLSARHCTLASLSNAGDGFINSDGGSGTAADEIHLDRPAALELIVLSAADSQGINRITQCFKDFIEAKLQQAIHDPTFLDSLAYTVDSHRSNLAWRSFALLKSPAGLEDLKSLISVPVQVNSKALHIGYIFTGQGAQWFAMGRELMCYGTFTQDLLTAEGYLKSIGYELSMTQEHSNIDDPEYSQTLCIVLQVALVNLLRRFGVRPSGVVGHSSGEVAAAYAAGHITAHAAWRVAFFRGLCSKELSKTLSRSNSGAMMSVGLSENQAMSYVEVVDNARTSFGISVACIKGPGNVTISREDHLINSLGEDLNERGVCTHRLRVTVAYHSRQMQQVLDKYLEMIGSLSAPRSSKRIPMVSTVLGKSVTTKELNDPAYWVANMVSPVQFHKAVSGIGQSTGYWSVLKRGESALATTIRIMGELHSRGEAIDLRSVNEPAGPTARNMLVDVPQYPFDHSRGYWHESRLSQNYRLRKHPPSELLGVRSPDWNWSDARWRHFLTPAEMPWVEHHVVNGSTLYPAAGIMVMAIEAAKQFCEYESRSIEGYSLRDIHFIGIPTRPDRQHRQAQGLNRPQKNRRGGYGYGSIRIPRWFLCGPGLGSGK